MLITNNHTSFHLWWKENLVKYQKDWKYYVHDCGSVNPLCSRGNIYLPERYPYSLNLPDNVADDFATPSLRSNHTFSSKSYIVFT